MTTAQEKQYIVEQRALGKTFVQIGEQLGKSGNTVRMTFERMTGMAPAKAHIPNISKSQCRYCGKDVVQAARGVKRRFCSDKCRFAWYNERRRRTPYKLVCQFCGREFISFGNPHRRYCSRQCFADWQKESQDV